MKKQKPKAKPGSAKATPAKPVSLKSGSSKATATKTVKAKPPVKVAAKPVLKPAAKQAPKLDTKSAGKPTKANVKAAPAKAPLKLQTKPAKAPTGKPVKSAGKPEVKPLAVKPVEAKAPVKTAAKVEKPVKAVAPKAQAAPKVEAKPVVIEEPDQAEDVILTDADGRRYCRVKDCDRLAEVDAYCRYHYILLWKNIQTRRHILQEGKLERYIEELTARYPDKFLEILKKDLRSEKDFLAAIQELEIDESAVEAEFDDEESQSDLFEIQRVSDSGGGGARSEEDDRF